MTIDRRKQIVHLLTEEMVDQVIGSMDPEQRTNHEQLSEMIMEDLLKRMTPFRPERFLIDEIVTIFIRIHPDTHLVEMYVASQLEAEAKNQLQTSAKN